MHNQFSITRDAEIKFFTILFVALSLLLVTSFILGSKIERGDNSSPSETVQHSFPEVSIKARAVYVYDARTKTVLYAKNENTRLPLASLTKIMAALVAHDISPEYGTVTVSREALLSSGDSGLKSNERWALKDLLDFSLITSSNDGITAVALSLGALSQANATSEEIINDFVGEMNKKASELDLKNTYFRNETGLDESEVKGGAYGSARDMTTLLESVLIYTPELLEATREPTATLKSLDGFVYEAKNTNDLARFIPGLLASKTGFTDTAGGNLVFIFDPELGRPIIVTILGSTEEGRFEDAKVLINATLKYIHTDQQ